jgi:hypothetical protein
VHVCLELQRAAGVRKGLRMFSVISELATYSPLLCFYLSKISVWICAWTGAQAYYEYDCDDFSRNNVTEKGGPTLSKLGSNSTAQLHPKHNSEERLATMPPAIVMTRLILIMV